MSRAEDYQRQSVECLELAKAAGDSHNKTLLLEMAHAWLKLAEHINGVQEREHCNGEPDNTLP